MMVPTNIWTVLCSDVIIDQETNAVSYIRCVEELCVSKLPIEMGPVFVATLWDNESNSRSEIGFRISIVSPNKIKDIVLQTKPIKLDRKRHRLHFRISKLYFNEYGKYSICLEWKKDKYWTKIKLLPLTIRLKD